MSKASALAAAKAANKIKTAGGIPAAQVVESTDPQVEDSVTDQVEVAETANPTVQNDQHQESLESVQSVISDVSKSEVPDSTDPTPSLESPQPPSDSRMEGTDTPGDGDEIDFDAINAAIDSAVSAVESAPSQVPVDSLDAELAEIEELQSMVGKPTEEVKSTDKVKGGEKNTKSPNPNAGSGTGGGRAGKAVWLMLNNIPDQPPHIGPVTLTAAYDTALGVVNTLKAKDIILQRDGERGMDRFWHNGPMRIFYSATDPTKGEVTAPTPIRTGEAKARREPKTGKSSKESGATEELSAKEILAQQRAQALLTTAGAATPTPTIPDEDSLSAIISGEDGVRAEADEVSVSGEAEGESDSLSVSPSNEINGGGDRNDALPWQ